jgi:hypothetical protein
VVKYILVLLMAIASGTAGAQVYKCKGADGKLQFSDTRCKAGHTLEIVPDHTSYVTPQQRLEAQQRAAQMQGEAAARDTEKANVQAAQQARIAERAQPVEAPVKGPSDSDAMAKCVRDVERQGASEKVKAELLAACRTSGVVQRSSGTAGDTVSDCVKNVERTGAAGKTKATEIARCHGAYVNP